MASESTCINVKFSQNSSKSEAFPRVRARIHSGVLPRHPNQIPPSPRPAPSPHLSTGSERAAHRRVIHLQPRTHPCAGAQVGRALQWRGSRARSTRGRPTRRSAEPRCSCRATARPATRRSPTPAASVRRRCCRARTREPTRPRSSSPPRPRRRRCRRRRRSRTRRTSPPSSQGSRAGCGATSTPPARRRRRSGRCSPAAPRRARSSTRAPSGCSLPRLSRQLDGMGWDGPSSVTRPAPPKLVSSVSKTYHICTNHITLRLVLDQAVPK